MNSHLSSSLSGVVVEQLIVDDIEIIAQTFQQAFYDCVRHVEKPNVLIAGVTGAGKSSLVNAIFGSTVAQVGDGVSVTQHFTRIEPPDKPVVIYDSRGLEDGYHQAFIDDTSRFFDSLRSRPQLKDHIHVIWYVVNAASGRFEPFEVQLVKQVFSPTPVLFLLNKADIASAQQLTSLEELIASHKFENNKGVFRTVAHRKNYSQNWCPICWSDDVTFKKTSLQLYCEECDRTTLMELKLNLGALIERTASLLPDLAKEAFLFSQIECLQERDKRAKEIVLQYASNISMDVSGKALNEVGEMVGRIFVLWGWNYLGLKVCDSLVREMKEEYNSQELSVRLAMIAADTILKRKLSRAVIACLGVMVNKPLRRLSEQLLTMVEQNKEIDVRNFDLTGASEEFTEHFMQLAFESGIAVAIDQFWYEN